MCNLYSITTNQAAIAALFRVVNRYVGNLAPMPGVFPDYPAPVIRNTDAGTEMTADAVGDAAATAHRRTAGHEHPQHLITSLAGVAQQLVWTSILSRPLTARAPPCTGL